MPHFPRRCAQGAGDDLHRDGCSSRLDLRAGTEIGLGLYCQHSRHLEWVVAEVETVAGPDLHHAPGQAGEQLSAADRIAAAFPRRAEPRVYTGKEGMAGAGPSARGIGYQRWAIGLTHGHDGTGLL